jgi:hypothetical protein
MQMKFLNGKFLEQESLVKVKSDIFRKEGFNNLFTELTKGSNVNKDQLKVISYEYDFIDEENKGMTARTTQLFLEDRTINISVTEGVLEGHAVENIYGSKVVMEFGEKVLKGYEVQTDNEAILTYETPYNEELKQEYSEMLQADNELPNDPSYNKEADRVNVMSVFDFCLAGGYKWCGKGCGYATGGGTPINGVDRCCKTHDDCYKNYSSDRCSRCDNPLIQCISPYKWSNAIAYGAIFTFFNSKCNLVIV